jgi:hypothetical protein
MNQSYTTYYNPRKSKEKKLIVYDDNNASGRMSNDNLFVETAGAMMYHAGHTSTPTIYYDT